MNPTLRAGFTPFRLFILALQNWQILKGIAQGLNAPSFPLVPRRGGGCSRESPLPLEGAKKFPVRRSFRRQAETERQGEFQSWQGRLDSNQRMRESKSLALPLGYVPVQE